ncbi:chemotaxis protein CheB [Streptomyces sp. KL116D]|uniref:chemotaxis protein CheB n=1 Tax=Streptomyces sp. KL116D TaxID=3045152 RepID=UPI003557F41D
MLSFESVAGAYGSRAVAVVLTGTGNDGAMGVDAVKSRGGTVIAQDPETAEFFRHAVGGRVREQLTSCYLLRRSPR